MPRPLRLVLPALLLLLPGVSSLAQDSARDEWERRMAAGRERLGNYERPVTDGEIRAAEREFRAAAEAAEKGGLPECAIAAHQLRIKCRGSLYDYAGMLSVVREILGIREKMGPEGEKGLHDTLRDLGYLLHMTGNPRGALAPLTRAADWFRSKGEPHRADHADALAILAEVHFQLGHYARALAMADEALALKLKDGEPVAVAEGLQVLARIQNRLGNVSRAESLLREALRIAGDRNRELSLDLRSRLAALLSRTRRREEADRAFAALAGAYLAAGDRASAAFMHVKRAESANRAHRPGDALARARTAKRIAPGDTSIACSADYEIGRAHLALGKTEPALEAFRACVSGFEESGSAEMLALSESAIAGVLLARKKPAEAVPHLRRALARSAALTSGLSPLTRLALKEEFANLHDRAVRAAFAGSRPEVAFELVERTRAALLISAFGGDRGLLPERLEPEEEALLEAANAKRVAAGHRYEDARAGGVTKEIRSAYGQLKAAEREQREILDRLIAARGLGALAAAPIEPDLAGTRAWLGEAHPDAALVLYAAGGGDLFALVIRPGKAYSRRLGPLAEIEDRAEELRAAIQEGEDAPDPAPLRSALLEPLDLGDDVKHLLVSPDGPVGELPLSYLDPGRVTVLVPSATALVLLARESGGRGEHVLAVGAPRYGAERRAEVARLNRGRGDLYDLPGSRSEVVLATGKGDTRLLGPEATETGFRRALGREQRWRAVHIACHGILDLVSPEWSSLALTEEPGEDGLLTVAEILTLRIPADLAVLSACSTGVGRNVSGEGLLALPGAFLHAGTPRVLASLWDVDDAATRAFVRAFYDRWKPGTGAAAALRAAQAEIRRQGYTKPSQWAGWVLWGVPE